MSIKMSALIAVIAFIAGIAVSRFQFPSEVKEETKQNDVVTIIKEVIRPDGTKEVDTRIVDRTKEVIKEVQYKKPDWRIQGGVGVHLASSLVPVYSVGVERRILGPMWLGAGADTTGLIKLTVAVEF